MDLADVMPQPGQPGRSPRRPGLRLWIIVAASTLALILGGIGVGWSLSDDRREVTATPTPMATTSKPALTQTPDARATTTAAAEPQQLTVVTCEDPGGQTRSFVIVEGPKGLPDFSEAWTARTTSCDSYGRSRTPTTDLEKSAYAASGYATVTAADGSPSAPNVQTLYDICAADIDPYADLGGPSFQLSDGQAAELRGALILCPSHPTAAAMRQEIKNAVPPPPPGSILDDGTYLVGKDIKPGPYKTTSVVNCYWERDDASGNIIDNGFYLHKTLQVVVIIAPSDYAFKTQSCGVWVPMG